MLIASGDQSFFYHGALERRGRQVAFVFAVVLVGNNPSFTMVPWSKGEGGQVSFVFAVVLLETNPSFSTMPWSEGEARLHFYSQWCFQGSTLLLPWCPGARWRQVAFVFAVVFLGTNPSLTMVPWS